MFEEVALEATVKSDETTELQATNQPVQVRLKIYKRDAEEARKDNTILDTRGDGLLTGAEFRVLAGADIPDRQGNVLYAKDLLRKVKWKFPGNAVCKKATPNQAASHLRNETAASQCFMARSGGVFQ